jgi:exodeoxyribonuclease V gamma subunit
VECRSRLVGEKKTFWLGPVGNPGLELAKLLGYYRQGLCRPLPFFVKSAWAYAEIEPQHGGGKALQAAHKVWDVPAFRTGAFFGESENAYYQAVYRGKDPLDGEFERISLDIIAPLMAILEEDS